MTAPLEETGTQPVEVTCPGCFHPREWDLAGVCPICHYRAGQAGRSGALLPVGTQLKGYVVGEKLGQGGFGITYRGFDLTLKMKVAIKEYYPSDLVGRSTDRKTVMLNALDHGDLFNYGRRTFLKEAQTVAQLRHPHLVRVLNFFELNDTAYLVMDYYEGEDLARHLKASKGQPLPWRRAVQLLLPVLDGLCKVHQAGFMHRDIKPGNLYLTSDDELILLDFGSARQVTGTHTRSLLIFSAGYAPYEQYLQGELNRQGPWTDVYGAAATLYCMVTGQRLPPALDRKQAALLQQPDPLKPARHWVADLPLALDTALLRALAVEPEQRLQTIPAFQQHLATALTEADRSSPEPTTAPTLPIPPKKVAPEPPKAAPTPPPKPKMAPEPPKSKATPTPPKTAPQPSAVPEPSARPKQLIVLVALAVIGMTALGSWWFWEEFGTGAKTPATYRWWSPPMVTPPPVERPSLPSRPVQALLADRYRDNGDGTVTDVKTSLQWMRCSLGQEWENGTCVGKAKTYGRQSALEAAAALNRQRGYAIYLDWRVPTREELQTLIYCSNGQPKTWNDTGQPCQGDYESPTIYQSAFPNTPLISYWSVDAPDNTVATWLVYFINGYSYAYGNGSNIAVRLVRGGP